MKKKLRCTPRKIKKISRVSALKLFFEQDNATSSGGPIGTGPRQSATSGASTSQDWPRQARVVRGEPMGDALLWAGGEEQCTVSTDNVQTVQK